MTWQSIAIPFIQGFESCELTAYHGAADRPGLYTCGWGSTGPDVTADTVWTQAQADTRFANDLEIVGVQVDNQVKVAMTDHQKAALVSFTYNLGEASLERSTLLSLLNARNYQGAAMQFPNWNHSNGVIVPGLTRRRLAEQRLFNEPDEVTT